MFFPRRSRCDQCRMGGGAEGLKEGWGEEPLAPDTSEKTRQTIPALAPSRGLLPGMENTLATRC